MVTTHGHHAALHPTRQTDSECLLRIFNGKLRIECLRQHWFKSLAEARLVIEDWRLDYNHVRPHSALGQMAPIEALLTEKFYPNSHSEYSG